VGRAGPPSPAGLSRLTSTLPNAKTRMPNAAARATLGMFAALLNTNSESKLWLLEYSGWSPIGISRDMTPGALIEIADRVIV
jgi:hypothetical protein